VYILIKNLKNRFIKNETFIDTIIVLSGSVISQGINFLSIIVLARYFGPENIALYLVSIALLTLLIALSDSGISNTMVNFVNKGHVNSVIIKGYLKVGFYIRMLLGLLVSLIGILISESIAIGIYNNDELTTLFYYAFSGVIILSINSYLVSLFQAQGRFICRAKFQIKTALVRLASTLGLIFFIPSYISIETLFIAYIFSPILILIFYSREIVNVIIHPLEKDTYKKNTLDFFHYSKWIFLSMLAILVSMRIDQFMLLGMTTSEETGYYVIALQLAMVLPLITESITTVLLPKVSNISNDLDTYRKTIIRKLTPVCLLILILVIIPSDFLIPLLFGKDYTQSILIFKILAIGFCIGILVNPLSLIFYSLSKVWYLTVLNYLQLIFIILLNLLFIPSYGALGATVGTVAIRIFALFYILFITAKLTGKSNIKYS
jgi:O-antigen/teichoic acid export membrane protein